MIYLALSILIHASVFSITSAAHLEQRDWTIVDDVLRAEIANHTFPGCVALVGGVDGIMYERALGQFTYGLPAPASGSNPPMTMDTLFDIASLTKVL